MNTEQSNQDLQAATEHIRSVLQAHKQELLSKPHVVGVAIGFHQKDGESTQNLALVVMVDQKVPVDSLTQEELIPFSIDGVPIDVQEVGKITAQ